MKIRFLAALLVLLLAPAVALAQSSPGFVTGQVPSAAQWNAAFSAKQDYSPLTPTCAWSPCQAAVTTFPSSVLVTNPSGTISFQTALPSGMTIPNPNLTGTVSIGSLLLSSPLNPSFGGSGAVSFAGHSVLLGEGSLAFGTAAVGTAGRVLVDQGGSADPAFQAISGDGFLLSTGALTVNKTGGVAFAASATTDTTNAANIGSGTLPAGRLPAFSGDLSSSAGSAAPLVVGLQGRAVSSSAPASTNVLAWNGTAWAPAASSGGTGTVGSGTTGQIPGYASAGTAVSGVTVSGDGTLSGATGALVVTKTNGVPFAASATTDTTNASNIASGTLSGARLPTLSGDVSNSGATLTVIGLQGRSVAATAPASTNVLAWNGAAWAPAAATGGTGTVGSGTTNQIAGYASTGTAVAGITVSGDGTLNGSTGALVVTKTNGSPFVASATTDTTNAANISSGTLVAARGGTGNATNTAHAVALGEGTSPLGFATIGTGGRTLIDQGAGLDPAFEAFSGDATLSSAGLVTVTGLQGRALSASAPASTNVLAWNGTAWAPAAASGGSGTVGSGTANQIAGYGSTGTAVSGVTVSGDGTLNGSTGALSVTKTGGVAFAASATTDTTNAANISSGTLPAARLPAPGLTALGGIEAINAVSHQFATAINTSGILQTAQPLFTDISGTAAIGQGGTGQTTAAAARASSGLNIDQETTHGDSAYTILNTDRYVATNATLTLSRTWTLPAASTLNPGQEIVVADQFGGVSGTNTLSISRAGSDTISGVTTVTLNTPYAAVTLRSDGVSKWTATAPSYIAFTPVNPANNGSDFTSVPTTLGTLEGGTPTSITTTGSVAVTSAETYLAWNPGTPAATTATLPASPVAGERHTFKDLCNCAFGLKVAGNTGQTIDGNAYWMLVSFNDAMTVKYAGSNAWSVVH